MSKGKWTLTDETHMPTACVTIELVLCQNTDACAIWSGAILGRSFAVSNILIDVVLLKLRPKFGCQFNYVRLTNEGSFVALKT